jgi:hypothetical protein
VVDTLEGLYATPLFFNRLVLICTSTRVPNLRRLEYRRTHPTLKVFQLIVDTHGRVNYNRNPNTHFVWRTIDEARRDVKWHVHVLRSVQGASMQVCNSRAP